MWKVTLNRKTFSGKNEVITNSCEKMYLVAKKMWYFVKNTRSITKVVLTEPKVPEENGKQAGGRWVFK